MVLGCDALAVRMNNGAVALALVASETANGSLIVATLALYVVVAALVGRWWTLLVPVALIAGVLVAGLSDSFYSRVPEDVQAGVVFGASFGLVLAILVLLARELIARHRGRPSS
jgi:hypothetical protein